MRHPCICLLCVAATVLPGCTAHARHTDGLGVGWLSGSWVMERGQRRSEESWTQPRGDMMLGLNRTVAGGRTEEWEFLRIERTPQGIVYFASPGGRSPATPFTLVESSDRRAVFENREHDFPQRIIYERSGNRLDARVEGVEDGQPRAEEWSWRRAGDMP